MNNIQINGQRRWGPPESWTGPPPPHGTEVFIKNLPEQVFELELYATFSAAGAVYEVRLPVNWDGLNRGYAFVRFTTVRAADEAIETFDGYEIRRNRKIKVARSVDNTRLFLSAVPIDKNADDLKRDLSNYVENVKKVYVYPTVENPSNFRGYAFVEFETHRDAAIAKRLLTPDLCYGLFEKKCVAAWANPLPFLDRTLLKSLNVLFMRNIPKDIKSFHLKKAIQNMTGGEEITRVKKMNNFAFLTFKDHKSAERALHQLQSMPFLISDHETQVEWAIPREMVTSSFLALDKECEASGTTLKGCEESKMDDHGRFVFKEEQRLTNRFRDFPPSSESPDLVLSTRRDVMPRNRYVDDARMIECESANSYGFHQNRLREIENKMGLLPSKTILSPSLTLTPHDKNDPTKIVQSFSDSIDTDTWTVNNAFQNNGATKKRSFLGFCDASFEAFNISGANFSRPAATTENREARNLWRTSCGEESDCGSEEFFTSINSDTSPLSPSAMTSRSADSPISSPFSLEERDIFSPRMFEELFFKKNKEDATPSNNNYLKMKHPENDKFQHFNKVSLSEGMRLETSSLFACHPTLHHNFIKRK